MLTSQDQNSSCKIDFANQLKIIGFKNVMCIQFYPFLHVAGYKNARTGRSFNQDFGRCWVCARVS